MNACGCFVGGPGVSWVVLKRPSTRSSAPDSPKRGYAAQPFRALVMGSLLVMGMACGGGGASTGGGGETKAQRARELPKPTAGQLCDHSREVLAMGHGARIDDDKWSEIRPGCIKDFEAKGASWGDAVYESFLKCGLAAQDMRTLVTCNERAEHHAGQPAAPVKPAPTGDAEPSPG